MKQIKSGSSSKGFRNGVGKGIGKGLGDSFGNFLNPNKDDSHDEVQRLRKEHDALNQATNETKNDFEIRLAGLEAGQQKQKQFYQEVAQTLCKLEVGLKKKTKQPGDNEEDEVEMYGQCMARFQD